MSYRTKSIVGAALLSASAMVNGGSAKANRDRSIVEGPGRLSPVDITRHHMRGSGCAFITSPKGAIRFVASGERALISLGGRYLALRPALNAPETFPFTFDRWVQDDFTVSIVRTPASIAQGNSIRQRARMIVAGRRFSWRKMGVLACGT